MRNSVYYGENNQITYDAKYKRKHNQGIIQLGAEQVEAEQRVTWSPRQQDEIYYGLTFSTT